MKSMGLINRMNSKKQIDELLKVNSLYNDKIIENLKEQLSYEYCEHEIGFFDDISNKYFCICCHHKTSFKPNVLISKEMFLYFGKDEILNLCLEFINNHINDFKNDKTFSTKYQDKFVKFLNRKKNSNSNENKKKFKKCI